MMKAKNLLFVFLLGMTFLSSCNQKDTATSSSSLSTEKYSLNDALKKAQNSAITIYGDIYTVFDEYDGEVKTNYIEMAFDEGIISAQLSYYYDDTTIIEEEPAIYFEKSDGKTYYRTITLDNEVKDMEYRVNEQSVIFEENFFNPFTILKFSDFIEGSNRNEYILKPSIATDFALSVLHLSVVPQTIYLQVNQNRFESIIIKTQTGLGSLGLSSSERYELYIDYDIPLQIPELSPYKHESQHDLLSDALLDLHQQLSQKNYTAHILMTDLDGIETYSSSNYYVTAEAIYHDSIDSNGMSYGIVQQNDGLHEFVTYINEEKQVVEILPDVLSKDRAFVEPNFLGFASEIFDIEGNTYYAKTNYLENLVMLLFPYTIRDYLAYYSFELAIELDENHSFKQMIVSYSDTSYMQSGMVIITYDHIGTTTLPVQI